MSAEALPYSVRDADTGNLISFFVRRREPMFYLRDPTTKRLIKRLYGIEVRVYMVVDYSETEAKKGNPLYLDAVTILATPPIDKDDLEDKENHAEVLCDKKVTEYFGVHVATQLLDLSGYEYGSEVRSEFWTKETKIVRGKPREVPTVWINRYYWSLVWKHRKEEEPDSREGFELI